MKYLFVINNPITDLITKKLIASNPNKYQKDNVVVLTYRDYKSDHDFETHALPILRKKPLFVLTWIEIYRLNKLLNSLNDFYCVHLPTTGFEIFQLLINHKKCHSYCYLEEGLASYYSVTEKNKFHSSFIKRHSNFILKPTREIYHFLNFGNKVLSYSDFFDVSNHKYNGSYCFSSHCFGEHPKKELLEISFNRNESLNDISTVLVLESLVEVGLLKNTVYLKSLEWLITNLIKQGKRTIYYKFHPDQLKSKVSIKSILNLFKKFKESHQLSFREIDAKIKLEDIAYNSLESEFYMIASSVAIYADICGRKAYSFYKQVLSLDNEEAFKNYMKTVPSEYFKIALPIHEEKR